MFTFAALKGLLFNKVTLYVILGLVAAWALHMAYRNIQASGADKERARLMPRIAQLEKDLSHEQGVVSAARKTNQNQQEAHAKALAALKLDYRALLTQISDELTLSEQRVEKLKKEKSREHIRTVYVSAKADAACVVPRGFVRLHNEATGNPADPAGPTEGPAVPASGPSDADTPSAVALSEVGATVAENYTSYQTVAAGLKAWQTWYKGAFAAWQEAVRAQGAFTIVVPPSPQ